MSFFSYQLFTIKSISFRVIHLLVIIIILMLLISIKSCTKNTTDYESKTSIRKLKKDSVNNKCQLVLNNTNELQRLLSSSDLCSKSWFKDYDTYIKKIKDITLELDKEKNKDKQLIKLHDNLLKVLNEFKVRQDEETIINLETVMKEYLNYYTKKCLG